MRFITLLQQQKSVIFTLIGTLLLASCGSYQYVGLAEDGIYGAPENEVYAEIKTVETSENNQGNSYYKDYFKGKANEYSNDSSAVFTDVDTYNGSYNNTENTNDKTYAGWGQNSDSQVVINVQTRPYFMNVGWGYPFYSNRWGRNNWGWNVGWNNWGWNNWGWNVGWNNWGWNWGYQNFGFWDPYFYNAWQSPYGYAGNFYYNRGRNVALINGYRNTRGRNSGYRSGSLSSRSALGTVSRTRSTATRSTNASRNSYNTTRSTTTRSIRNSNGTRTTTRSTRTTTQPTRSVRSNTRTTRPTTTRSTRTTTRPTYSRPTTRSGGTMRSSGSTTRSRGGSTSRRRN